MKEASQLIDEEYKKFMLDQFSEDVTQAVRAPMDDVRSQNGAVSRNGRRGTKQSRTVNQSSRPIIGNMQERIERL